MPTISAKVSQKEFETITEFANQCGETISNLVRKVMIAEATFLFGGFEDDPKEYEYGMSVPDNISDKAFDRITEANHNKIRRILGWKEISL
jgi:hypothetical protein